MAADFVLDLEELNEISPRPGTIISSENYDQFRHLIDSDFGKFISGDFYSIAVGQPSSFAPHQLFVNATRTYGGEATISDNEGTLDNFSQGLPFPEEFSTKDLNAGRKLAWNMRYAYQGDNGEIPEMHWKLIDWRSEKIEFEMDFKAKLMRFMYRHIREPKPFVMNNVEDAYGAFRLEAIDAGSYDGTQALVFANRDESQKLNGWVYIPQLGRTQTLASFSAEESMFGSDVTATDFLSYTGRLTDISWEYKGRTFMLLPMYNHNEVSSSDRKSRKYDYWHTKFTGRASCFPQVNWQLRETLILEGRTKDPDIAVAKRILYLDKQTHLPLMWKLYKKNSILWKFAINAYSHPDYHLDSNRDSGAPILTAFASIDIQTNRCTTLQTLVRVNVDNVGLKDFDVGDMRSATGRDYRRR